MGGDRAKGSLIDVKNKARALISFAIDFHFPLSPPTHHPTQTFWALHFLMEYFLAVGDYQAWTYLMAILILHFMKAVDSFMLC